MHIAIIGASAAGLSCLDTLVALSPDTRVTVISEEDCLPYSKILLTYAFAREFRRETMILRDPSSYPSRVTFLLGKKVEEVSVTDKTLTLSGGEIIAYDKLLFATGASAIKPDYVTAENRCFNLRYLHDALRIGEFLKKSAVVAGGGFVGIKTAYGLIERGIRPILLVSSGHILSLNVDEQVARLVERDLRGMGVDIRTGEDVVSVKAGKDGARVTLKSGTVLDADVVVVGKGVRPRVMLARQAGAEIDLGIRTNEHLETSIKDHYAAGDCCENIDYVRGVPWVNAIWPVATEQGYYAALNMAGVPSPYRGSMAVNSLKLPGLHLVTGGILWGEGVTTVERYVPARNQLRKLALRDGIPVGLAFYNNAEEAGPYLNLIRKGRPLRMSPQAIVDGDITPADLYELQTVDSRSGRSH
ncbi:MAG TPA: FAD-dependent oxidoreductase [Dissulfurispiraceae bacterium]|nr:FAD-dependent oxidoreductase [Dissulfurispiraceae bacterium]